jgi:hypothetical protein
MKLIINNSGDIAKLNARIHWVAFLRYNSECLRLFSGQGDRIYWLTFLEDFRIPTRQISG